MVARAVEAGKNEISKQMKRGRHGGLIVQSVSQPEGNAALNRSQTSIASLVSLALLGTGFAISLSVATAAERADSGQVAKLIPEVTMQASRLSRDAFMVQHASTHSNVNLNGRATEVREHLHEVGGLLIRLGEQRSAASPQQVATIDRIQPFLKEMVENTETLVRYLEKGQDTLNQQRDHIGACAGLSSGLASLIESLVRYGDSKQRLARVIAQSEGFAH